jgi:hypothetical protein
MATASLKISPGVDVQSTALQSERQINASNLIRFKSGLIERLGGCTRLINAAFNGIASAIMPWADLNTTQYVAIGTTTKLQLLAAGAIVDITPASGVGGGSWSLDKWGQDLVAAVQGGALSHWVPPVSGGNIAIAIPNAPPVVNGLIVAAPEQQIITWGAYSLTLGQQDPLLLRWCDIGNLTVWVAATNNQAGSFRIPNGSRIVAVVWAGLNGIVWTDLDTWSMTYVNYPLVYALNRIGESCGLIAPKAVGVLGGRTAWLSQNDFFVLQGGQPQVIPCSVRDIIFNNLDRTHVNAIHCDVNTWFNEFKWYFPVTGSGGVCTAYVKWSPTEGGQNGLWDYGLTVPNLSAWADQSVIGAPIGADYAGLIQQYETAIDFDGVAYNPWFETGWFELDQTQDTFFVEKVFPDFTFSPNAVILFTLTFADEFPDVVGTYPQRTYGPYTVTPTTPFFIVRGSGRVAKIRVENTALNSFWRYGEPRARITIDGRAA